MRKHFDEGRNGHDARLARRETERHGHREGTRGWDEEENHQSQQKILTKEKWCPGEDLNLHALRHWLLRPACLPFHHPGPDFFNA